MKIVSSIAGRHRVRDELADALLAYAATLARLRRSVAVELPMTSERGRPGTLSLLIGHGHPLAIEQSTSTEHTEGGSDHVDETELIAAFQSRTALLRPADAAPEVTARGTGAGTGSAAAELAAGWADADDAETYYDFDY